MFVEASDFDDIPYKIPNQEEMRNILDWLEKEEAKLLKKVLGLRLYNEFIEGLETSGDIEQRWIDLREGTTYEYNEKLYEYLGVVDFIKPYIVSLWNDLMYRKQTTSGVIINQGQQNTQVQTPDYEVVKYWNEASGKIGDSCERENTLYGFLKANESDYEDLEFCSLPLKNQFNL